MRRSFALALVVCGVASVAYSQPAGDQYRSRAAMPPDVVVVNVALPEDARAAVLHWNQIAIDMSGLDHTPVTPHDQRVFGEQLGPGRASRAMAIVHIAIADAVLALNNDARTSYTKVRATALPASTDAAIATAAHGTLVALYPSQTATCDKQLAAALGKIKAGRARTNGARLGATIARRILRLRQHDGSDVVEPRMGIEYIPEDGPGVWHQDPISQVPIALGAFWGMVEPFAVRRIYRLLVDEPPALDSDEYAAAYAETKRLGGDGVHTPSERTADQTQIGIFWAYDGTPSLCAPPRLYNQVARQITHQMGSDAVDLARLLAILNIAAADAATAAWDSKFYWALWRPITAIRATDDPTWTPLGAPASNLAGPNFTPPFPAYPSGHATIGGAIFEVLRQFYGTDDVSFTFVSDEFNGDTVDNEGHVRPLSPRAFQSFSQAELENGRSRIYLGIHFDFDRSIGAALGHRVAKEVGRRVYLSR